MVKVYFETSSYAELIAIFEWEETYLLCLPALEEQALESGFTMVTESIEEEIMLTDLKLS